MFLRSLRRPLGNNLSRYMSSSASFEVTPFETHHCDGPSTSVELTKDEAFEYFRDMFSIRRMELELDVKYKAKFVRGFCHLYDGQEAVAVGTEAALSRDDGWITSYRCHAAAYVRGVPIKGIFAELFGNALGCMQGKGGSMHLYDKAANFYGGAAIVGAQVPVGAGIGFAQKYLHDGKSGPMNVSVSMCGDGSANQGQCWEAANMAALWDLPHIFLIENNKYGMGTSTDRSSALTEYYKQGNIIPGIKCDGMDVLAVKECMKYCKDFAGSGNGPIFVEMSTYRYHGHSMSDPGISYRERSEVAEMRTNRDCIKQLKNRILEAGWATEEELEDIEAEIKASVASDLTDALAGQQPASDELISSMYVGESSFIRNVSGGDAREGL